MFLELHAQSAFSFLEGAEQPETLVREAARLDMPAIALVDRDGVYGAPRLHRAAQRAGIKPLVGAELTLAGGARLPVLVEDREGYANLCTLITRAKLGAPKGAAAVTLDDLEQHATGLVCLTGGARGPLADAVRRGDAAAARATLDRLIAIFGRSSCYVEVQRHLERGQERMLERLVALARRARLPLLATNQPLYALPGGRAVADVFTCIREKTDLDHAGRALAGNDERGLRSPTAMAERFHDLPGAAHTSGELALRLAFTLKDLGYRFPQFPVPPGQTPIQHLRELAHAGARTRYGNGPYAAQARCQIEHELGIIGRLDLAGYFLIVWDIVQYCRDRDVLVQGRGSAANSAVCYALGITAVDPVRMELLFERFLSEARGEWPDIDLDLPSGERREAIIQAVYRKYGPAGAGMTANVVTYRGRSAAREVGKALGLPGEMQERLAKLVENWGYRDPEAVLTRHLAAAGCDPRQPRIRKFAALWTRVQDLPRYLGQHSGGMVIAGGRLDEVVPLEPATMPGRVVIQWDKEDCADLGIVKVDLLGLRMMSVIQDSLALVRTRGVEVDIAHLPDDEKVYETLQRADTIGVFQVESRAQMATLPRIHPEHFYDLVVQVAIIRPGPIVGEMVHPYINRRRGREAVRYPHPSLEPILKRTLGVPLFQEQLLRVAMVAAGFTGSEAEELRRAFGFRRHEAKMAEIETKLRSGMTRNGITGRAADDIVHAITSFALYGFPESHAASFALLAYASAYLKVHHPAPFYASLLNHQPMGFYHAATVVKDAQRHGQRVLPVDVTRSTWLCMVEPTGTAADPGADAVRLGLRYVTGLREATGLALVAARVDRPFVSVADLIARTGLARDELSTLASIGALAPLGLTRRAALWRTAHPEPGPLFAGIEPSAPNLSRSHPPSYPGSPLLENSDGATPHPPLLEKPDGATPHLSRSHPPSDPSSPLRDMTELERLVADYGGTNVTIGRHPMALRRAALAREGVTRACDLPREASHARGGAGRLVRVAGSVIVRQRPGTAKGFVFLSLEDETGIANVIITPQLFARRRLVLVTEPFLLVEGILQSQDGVTSIRAKTVRPLTRLPHVVPSHDFG